MTENHPFKSELPIEPLDRYVDPFKRFLHVESAGGVVLLISTVAALVLANSSFSTGYLAFWQKKLTIGFGSWQMSHSLHHWINDGLMAVFFCMIGLEVKRELVLGELKDVRKASLPVAGFLAGIGFTMAFFISSLAMRGDLLDAAKVGVIGGSVIASLIGIVLLLIFLPRTSK